ncbi:MAG: sigma-70 family RNA polymerase sigma factor [Lachnospiraceae bacterium]|nr:sigma-70 family RNA polymerase sigma factor [Candidatus Colinaster equi]
MATETNTIEDIYIRYHDKVVNFIMRKVSNHDLAEDLASDVFLKVAQKYSTFDSSKASVSTWIYTIAQNRVIDHYRTNHISDELQDEIHSESNIEETLLNNETLEELACALEKLPERERTLIVLHYYNEKSLKEVALQMGMSYANAKIVHRKALQMLQQHLSFSI